MKNIAVLERERERERERESYTLVKKNGGLFNKL